jgi:hypothetical protein
MGLGAMALSEEDRVQAEELLDINERRLRVRDRQIERNGDNTDPEVILDAEELRRKIVTLKAILEPEIPDEISGLLKRRLEDDYFLFQTTLGAKQDVAILRDDVATVKNQQSLAATWRMQTDGRLDTIDAKLGESETARKKGAPFLRRVLAGAVFVAVLALIIGCIALALASFR